MARTPGQTQSLPATSRAFLRGLIDAKGLTIPAVARQAGMAPSNLHRFLNGETEGTTHLAEICDILDASMGELVDAEKETEALLAMYNELRARSPGGARSVMSLAQGLLAQARLAASKPTSAEGTMQTDIRERPERKKK